jgi:CshA-type fibril repeat protein
MSARLRVVTTLAILAALAALPAISLAGPVTLTTSASGPNTVVTATAPVVNATVTSGELTQTFNPLVAQITGASDVVAPQGWTVTYSADGTTYGAAPGTAAGWAAIRGVKATGPLTSTGASGSNQLISSTATVQDSSGGAINGTNASGDSWTVFTSPTRVYTMWHHNGRGDRDKGAFDCFLRDGTHCTGFPFMLTPLETGTRVEGWYDETYNHIWGVVSKPNGAGAGPGFVCVDVSGATPQYCGGSISTGFVSTGSVAPTNSGLGCGNTTGAALNCANDFAQIDGKLYAWEALTGKLMCVDTQGASGAGAPCTGQPYAFAGIGGAATKIDAYVTDRRSGLAAIGGKIYGAGTATPTTTNASIATCFDPATRTTCAGWPITLPGLRPYIYEQVDTSGTSQGTCFRALTTGATSDVSCYQPDGTAFGAGSAPAVNAGLRDALFIAGRTYGWIIAKNPVRIGTKYIWSNASWQSGDNGGSGNRLLNCYDVTTSAACTGWPKTGVLNYSMAADAYNAGCVWKATDDGSIQGYDLASGNAGCLPPNTTSIQAQSVLTDVTCGRNGVTGWQSIAVSGTTYTSATLTVKNGGTTVSGWNAAAFESGSVDLSTLTVANSGTNPTFEITFDGRNATAPIVQLTSISGPPQLCLTMHPQPAGCPTVAGQYADPLPSVSATITGAGTAATGGGTETFANGTTTVAQASATASQCLGALEGTTTVDGTTTPIPGIVVTLTDAAGTTIGTATTDANGHYSFPGLAALVAGYKVSFGTTPGMDPNAVTTAAPATPRTVTVGGTTVVDGQYTPQTSPSPVNPNPNTTRDPIAEPDFATTPKGTPVLLPLFGNDAASPGASLVPSSVRIQDPASGTWGTRVTVPGEGTYVVDPTSGAITFTPLPSFTGKTKPLPYRVTDTTGKTADTYVQITVVTTPPPYANPNFAAGKQGQTLILPALVNDTVTSGAFVPSSVVIKDPKTGKWGTTVVIPDQGTYTVNPTNGSVSFKPLPSFVGTATPVDYRVSTTTGARVRSSLHPRLIGPLPRLDIRTTATVPDLIPGQRTVIKLHACNIGKSSAVNTTIDLPIPAGFAVVQTRGATVRSGTAVWSTGTLAKGACVDRTILVVAVRQGSVKALGTVRASNAGPAKDPTPLRVAAGVMTPSGVTG